MEDYKLCYGCMRKIRSNAGYCPHCGFNYDEYMEKKNPSWLPPGTEIMGKWVIGKVLGQGGFGITYIGYDKTLETRMAIKEYYPNSMVSRTADHRVHVIDKYRDTYQEGLERFLDEARTLAKFRALSGIVKVHDFVEENGTGYIIMEYLAGDSLYKIIHDPDRTEMISPQEAVDMLLPVMDALEQIHEYGLIHRDISPDNLIQNDDGKLTLIDFGAARQISQKDKTVIIKQKYAPLEQSMSSGEQKAWTDVYALAVTIYEMITGATPTPAIERQSVQTDPVQPLKALFPPEIVSEKFSDAVEMGMSIDYRDRFQTVNAFKNALLAGLGEADEEPDIQPVQFGYDLPSEDQTKLSRRKVIVIVLLVLLALEIVGTIFVKNKSIRKSSNDATKTSSSSEGTTLSQASVSIVEPVGEVRAVDATFVTKKSSVKSGIPLYKSPTEESKKILPEGRCVHVIGKIENGGQEWMQVEYCGKQGWVQATQLRLYTPGNGYFQLSQDITKNLVFVDKDNKGGVYLHTAPSNDPSTRAAQKVYYGEELTVKSLENGFGAITYHGKDYYINMNNCAHYVPGNWMVEICDGDNKTIHFRSKADGSSKNLGDIPTCTVLPVQEFKKGWGKVTYKNRTGWIQLYRAVPCGSQALESEDKE